MSLINDALKRAKQAQQEATPPPPSNTDLRPVEQRQYGRPGVGLAVPGLLGIASLVLLFLLWQAARTSNSQDVLEVNARTKAPPSVARPPAEPAPSTAPAQAPTVASTTVVTPEPVQVASNTPPVTAIADSSTNPVPVVAVAPPKPALPKLQAVVFHPTRPSVLINGRSLFVGEKIGEYRVRSIAQDSVTLVGAGQTNILTLPE